MASSPLDQPPYTPLFPPQVADVDLQHVENWVKQELDTIARALTAPPGTLFTTNNQPPARPREGMTAFADGTHWNPGLGKGLYVYRNGVWTPVSYSNNLVALGGVADDSTDNTTVIQNLLNGGIRELYVPYGIFRCGQITIPSTFVRLWGPGTFRATGSFPAFGTWWLANAPADDLTVDGIQFIADASFNTNTVIGIVAGTRTRIVNCVFNGGRFPVQIVNGSVQSCVANCTMFNFNQSGVFAMGLNNTLAILYNHITHTGSTGHVIQLGEVGEPTSNDCLIVGNSLFGGPAFGIHVHNMTRGKIALNTVLESVLEAITVGGGSLNTLIAHNTARWVSASTDVGMSFEGDNGINSCNGLVVDGNIITNSYKGGILVAGNCQDFIVQNNRLIDVNSSNGASAPAAISVYDEFTNNNTLRNTVINNYASNAGGGHANYIVQEVAIGTPDHNYFAANYGRAMATGTAVVVGANSIQTGNVALP